MKVCPGSWEWRRSGHAAAQALLDMYTIKREIGRLENFSIGLVGDLANGVRSAAAVPPQRQPPVVPVSGQAPQHYAIFVGQKWGLLALLGEVRMWVGRGVADGKVAGVPAVDVPGGEDVLRGARGGAHEGRHQGVPHQVRARPLRSS